MNFQNVDIPVLAKFISEITGKNFVIDESVRGKVSIISPTKVTPEQAYSIFQSVLQVKGFTTVQAGQGDQDRARAPGPRIGRAHHFAGAFANARRSNT